jgi:hypothetical protein
MPAVNPFLRVMGPLTVPGLVQGKVDSHGDGGNSSSCIRPPSTTAFVPRRRRPVATLHEGRQTKTDHMCLRVCA